MEQDLRNIYYKFLLVRNTEYKIEELFSQGLLRGTTHGCIGQEVVSVVLSEILDLDKDYLCSGHRSHGLAVAFTLKPEYLIGELMGKACGLAGGLGGSQHLVYKHFFTNGITGGMVPVASGLAFALRQSPTDAVAVVCLGDGAMNEGYVMETMNLAKVLELPMVFVLENNGYAMSTSVEYATGVSFEQRVKGFGLPYSKVLADDYENVFSVLSKAVVNTRTTRKPEFVEVLTHRFCGHSKSDRRAYIPAEKDAYWQAHDVLKSVASRLSPEERQKIEQEAARQIENACNDCMKYGL